MDEKNIESLPTREELINILKKTSEKSWKNNLEISDIEKWLKNYKGEVFKEHIEQHLALWLLSNFSFFNQDDIRHLCKILHRNLIHQIIQDLNIKDVNEEKKILGSIKYSAIGRASQSGNFLLYDFRYEASLKISNFYYPTNIENKEETIIAFIDDVFITGDTAENFFKKNQLNKCKIYYCSIFVTESAIEKLNKLGVTVIYCNLLDGKSRCFGEESIIFNKYPDLLQPTLKLVEHYGQKLYASGSLGYKDSQLCIGFYYNTPNNTLPIFWASKKEWTPIFVRRGGEKYDYKRKFI